MHFDWGGFLGKLGQLAPVIVAGSMALAGETGNVSNLQEALDALHLATGVSEALGSKDVGVVASAKDASTVIGEVVDALQSHYVRARLVVPAPVKTVVAKAKK